jgi:hypothetical protein
MLLSLRGVATPCRDGARDVAWSNGAPARWSANLNAIGGSALDEPTQRGDTLGV